jgi:hypothetical protein
MGSDAMQTKFNKDLFRNVKFDTSGIQTTWRSHKFALGKKDKNISLKVKYEKSQRKYKHILRIMLQIPP